MFTPAATSESELLLAPPVYLCHCLKVTHDEVEDAIAYRGCRTVDDVTATCGAGGGCTGCHDRIRAHLAEQRLRAGVGSNR